MKYDSDILKRLIKTYGVVGNPRYISEIIKEFIVRGKERFPNLFTYQADWLAHIDEFGLNPTYTVSYTGQSIYAPNTLEKPVKSAILSGQTLVNLIRPISKTILGQYQDVVGVKYIEPSTKYLLKIKNNTSEAKSFYSSEITEWTQIDIEANQTITKILTTKSTLGRNTLLQNSKTHTTEHDLSIIFIKYQDGMENWDIPYFEGMQSVQMPVLKTVGKNLFDMNRRYDSITDTQATVVQKVDEITVSSVESGTYVNVNFVLDKNFFKGKTITGSCLYESDEKGIGTVQIKYQDTAGNNYYQSIKTSRTFTFPDEIVGEILLCIYPNNSNTPQSNTVKVKNIQLEEGSVATPYEPYKSNILTVNEPIELRGIGDLKDTLNCNTGECIERVISFVLDETKNYYNFTENEKTVRVSISTSNLKTKTGGNVFSPMFPKMSSSPDEEHIRLDNSSPHSNLVIGLNKSRLTEVSLQGVKQFFQQNSHEILLELAEPVIKTVDLSILDQNGENVKQLMTFNGGTHFNTTSLEGSPLPSLEVSVETDLEETLNLCSTDGNTL